jgi:hypothetical protein
MSAMIFRCFVLTSLVAAFGLLSGCATADPNTQSRTAMLTQIAAEPPGDYFIARRYHKVDYKFWGYVRKPGQSWATAKMVMLNEHQKLAPDRDLGKIGSDNGYEYKFYGNFSGDLVYEPASNGFYPEFVLKGFELVSTTPGSIFKTPGALDPKRRIIAKPY